MEHQHICYFKGTLTKNDILRSLTFILSRVNLEHLHISFVRPLLEYGDVSWDNLNPFNMKKPELLLGLPNFAAFITYCLTYNGILWQMT